MAAVAAQVFQLPASHRPALRRAEARRACSEPGSRLRLPLPNYLGMSLWAQDVVLDAACVRGSPLAVVSALKMEERVCVDQVDELYEAFCIQSRLREGAIRMKQAFSSSPSTKGTKESIAEVNRRYKEYTEVPSPVRAVPTCGRQRCV